MVPRVDKHDYVTVQSPQVIHGHFPVAKTEITEVDDGIFVGNSLIPQLNENIVHLVYVGKRSLAELDDVGVAEMLVAGHKAHSLTASVTQNAHQKPQKQVATFFSCSFTHL